MKCPKAEKHLLLLDSGELSSRKSLILEEHLVDCAACRQFRSALHASESHYTATEEPSLHTMQNILREARRNAPERKQRPVIGLKPVLAMASSAAIVLGVVLTYVNPDKVGMVYTVMEAQLLEPDDQAVSVMYDGLSEDDLAFNFLMTYRDNGS